MKRKTKITALELKLLALVVFMRDASADMEYYGGFSKEQKYRSRWMADMVKQVSDWARDIRNSQIGNKQ